MNYISKTISRVMLILLLIGTGLSLLNVLTTIIFIRTPDYYYDSLLTFDKMLASWITLIYYTVLVMYFIWLFRIHKALQSIDLGYAITPWGSMWRMLPIINLVGIGKVFSSISRLFESRPSTRAWAEQLFASIPFLYIVFFVGSAVDRYIWRQNGDVGNTIIMVSALFGLAFYAICAFMTHRILRCIHDAALEEQAKLDQVIQEEPPTLTTTL